MVFRAKEWEREVDGIAHRKAIRDGSDVGAGCRSSCGVGRQQIWSQHKKPSSEQTLPTRLTQRRRSEGRGREFILKPTLAPPPPEVCPGCGATTHEGRLCPTCGRNVSKEKLIGLAKQGRVVAQSPQSQKKRSETQRRHEAAKRQWRSSLGENSLDRLKYDQEIQPCLASVTIADIAAALGVCEAYAADIRSGRRRPHPRHWEVLGELVQVSPNLHNSE